MGYWAVSKQDPCLKTYACWHGGHNDNGAWSPVGRQHAVVFWRDGRGKIYMMNANGSTLANLTRNPELESLIPAWWATGECIPYRGQGGSGAPAGRSPATGPALGVRGSSSRDGGSNARH
jgi:Tol biopolymer transport system component